MKHAAHLIPHLRTWDAFQASVLDSEEAVFVAFLRIEPGYDHKLFAMQCARRRMYPLLKVFVLEGEMERLLSDALALEGTPTFMLFKDGQEKGRILGEADDDRLANFISSSLNTSR